MAFSGDFHEESQHPLFKRRRGKSLHFQMFGDGREGGRKKIICNSYNCVLFSGKCPILCVYIFTYEQMCHYFLTLALMFIIIIIIFISGLPAGYLDGKTAAGVGFILGSQLTTSNFLHVSFWI